jgi:hypothetical protein
MENNGVYPSACGYASWTFHITLSWTPAVFVNKINNLATQSWKQMLAFAS